jgi:hypothetical protein
MRESGGNMRSGARGLMLLAVMFWLQFITTDAHAQYICRLESSISNIEFGPDGSPNSEHPDGTLLMSPYSNRVYVVNHGAVFGVPNEAEFEAMGYQWDAIRVVKSGYLGSIKRSPNDGALLRERHNNTVYVFYGGYRFPIPDEKTLKRLGLELNDVRTVPRGALAGTRRIPGPGTLLQEEGDPRVYIMHDKRMRWIRTEDCFNQLRLDSRRIRIVPKNGLYGIPRGRDVY